MKFPVTLLLIPALLFGNQLLAQRVQFITNPDKAWVIMEGTSVVSRTSSNKKLSDGGVLIYKESHHPVYLESSCPPALLLSSPIELDQRFLSDPLQLRSHKKI